MRILFIASYFIVVTACGGQISAEKEASEEIRGHQGPNLASAHIKCDTWGYTQSTALLGGVMLAEYHASCVNLVRSNFCGDGIARTLQGTPIDIFDTASLNTVATSVSDGYFFEAAWGQKGALCLSKKRWSTLPLGGPCPTVLPDPRLPGSNAQFCEDIARVDLESTDPSILGPAMATLHARGARTISKSAFLDAGLYRWTSPYGLSPVSTTSGFFGGASWPGAASTIPPAFSGFEYAWLANYEGTVFTPTALSVLSLPAGSVVELKVWQSGWDYRTSVQSPGPYYWPVRSEGFIYAANVPVSSLPFGAHTRKLFSYTNASGVSMTTIESPPSGASNVRVEGYLLYLR